MNHHASHAPHNARPQHHAQQQYPQATLDMCLLSFDVLLLKLHQRSRGQYLTDLMAGMPLYTDPVLSQVKCPLFVTWDIWNPRAAAQQNNNNNPWELRGCIGSLQPLRLDRAITKYALTAALQDRRFNPIGPHEVASLRVKVSLLVQYEPCQTVYDWTVGVHGIMIEWTQVLPDDPREKVVGYNTATTADAQQQQQQHQATSNTRRYSATYLPEVAIEQGWNVRQAVESLIRKAGYQGVISTALIAQIRCTRYQSSKVACDFGQYCAIRQQQVNAASVSAAAGSNNVVTTTTTTSPTTALTTEAYQLAAAAAATAANGKDSANCQIM